MSKKANTQSPTLEERVATLEQRATMAGMQTMLLRRILLKRKALLEEADAMQQEFDRLVAEYAKEPM